MHSGVTLIDPHKIFGRIGLRSGMRVADMGCGRTGHFIFSASKVVENTGVVYAIDILKDVLENVRSRVRSEGYGNIHAVWSDIEKEGGTPIPEKSLDACFFVNVMFLLKQKNEAIREALRLLKENGFLVIVDWSKKVGSLGPPTELMVNPEDLLDIAKSVNAEMVENESAGDYHFCLILKKKGRKETL